MGDGIELTQSKVVIESTRVATSISCDTLFIFVVVVNFPLLFFVSITSLPAKTFAQTKAKWTKFSLIFAQA